MLREVSEKQRRMALKAVGFVALALLVLGVLALTGMFIWLADFAEHGFRSGPWSD